MVDSQKIAIVTGASSGIGEALVKELLVQGYQVIGISRSSEKLEKIKSAISHPDFSIYVCDVSDFENVKYTSNLLKKNHTIPDIFFLNAGLAGCAALETTDCLNIETHQKIFAVNYYGVLNFVEQWLQPCINKGGATFIVSSSVNAIFAPPGGSGYAASKAAISKAFDGLRITHAKNNLKFHSVFCGPVDTPGLVGQLPFTWSAQKMAKYMIKKAEKGTLNSNPSLFYSLLSKILNTLPAKQVNQFLSLFQ